MFKRKGKGFTLVELIIVIVILGILAALAVPQFVSSTKDAQDASTSADLAVLRNAVNLYYHQHNSNFPGAIKQDGSGPEVVGTMPATFIAQLTQYSDKTGHVSPTLNRALYPYGPYLNNGIPNNPQNNLSTVKLPAVPTAAIAGTDLDGTSSGWVVNPNNGEVRVNTSGYLAY